jgi:opacity protein-like surface antigen
MKGTILLVTALVGSTMEAGAQQVSEQRVRSAVEDAARGLGQTVAGGSPMTAPAATTGGLGHFLAAAGVAVTRVEIEDPQQASGTADFLLPTAAVRLAIGITGGTGSGGAIEGLGSVDLLGRVGIAAARDQIEDASKLYGLGARVGILSETALSPAASVSLMRTWTEEIAFGEPDEISFRGDVAVTSIRADLSKSFVLVSPYVGAGVDRTEIEASYTIREEFSTGGQDIRGSIDPSSTHQTVYAGIDLSLFLLAASVEAGIYDGGGFAAFAVRAGL